MEAIQPDPDRAARATAVLVAEDDVLVRSSVAAYLRDAGCLVIEAANADEAIEVLDSGAAIDVLFTDLEMPGCMNGLRLAWWTHEHFPEVRLLLTSGHGGWRDLPRDVDFLSKPYHLVEVLRRVRLEGPVRR